MEISPLESWGVVKKKPFVIAGPCSAETEEQLFASCKQIVENTDVDVLRAGIWKPRTRPNSFEGVGEVGLQWLANVKKELKIPTSTEVANPQHVELALKYGVDVLWIGARSTVNPFTIQEIADSLKGVDIPVIIKNPINPDVELWLGAFERINGAGITKLAALHRGFSTLEKSDYRNAPMWQLALDLKSRLPNLPMFCDPSHITGRRDMIFKVSQKALDLNYDGLMIESHIDPDNAWSDAKQQVTPMRLSEILHELKIRKPSSDDADFVNQIDELRKKIDRIDKEIIESLGARMEIVKALGQYKKDNNVTVFDVDRYTRILQSRAEWGDKLALDKNFVGRLYKLVHDEAIRTVEG
ncbi:MAG: 3-deoxy-7-phosphoheptulonate synthase [Bacteroidetes bacterium]|nr:MAG: 3-deoxy-7-phosphoheptulonate synthase [Bacteroidota bacterium]